MIGVGINLDLGDLDAASTSLGRPVIDLASLRGRSLDVEMRGALVARLLVEIVAAWETLVADGADSLLQDWPAFDCLGGKEVQATVYGRAVVGIARGISAEGALLLDLSRTAAEGGDRTNRVEVTAGEVTRLLPLR